MREESEVVTVAVSGLGGGVDSHVGSEEIKDGWSADDHPSTMTQQKLQRLREEYAIPISVRLRAPTGNEKPSTPPLAG